MWPSSERLKDPLTAEPMSSWSNPVFAAETEGDLDGPTDPANSSKKVQRVAKV